MAVDGAWRAPAWRIADQAEVNDDQRYSLLAQHRREVDERLAQNHPERRGASPSPEKPAGRGFVPRPVIGIVSAGGRRQRRLRFAAGLLGFTVGWGTWFRNRQVGLRDRWFRFRTHSAYGGQPPLNT